MWPLLIFDSQMTLNPLNSRATETCTQIVASAMCYKPKNDILLNCIYRWMPPSRNTNQTTEILIIISEGNTFFRIRILQKLNWRLGWRRKDSWLGIRKMTYTVFYSQRLWSSPPVTSQSIWKTSKSLKVNCQFTRQSMSNNWFLPSERGKAVCQLLHIWILFWLGLWMVSFYLVKWIVSKIDCADDGTQRCFQVELYSWISFLILMCVWFMKP